MRFFRQHPLHRKLFSDLLLYPQNRLQQEIGKVFVKVLEDAGVYKCTPQGREAFERFLNTVDFHKE